MILDPPRERSFKGPGFSPQRPPGAFVLSGGLQRIRYAHERTPGIWLWNVTVNIPCPPLGSASSLDEAKEQLLAFKEEHGRDKWPRPTPR